MFVNNSQLVKLKHQLHNQAIRVSGIVKKNQQKYGFLEVNPQECYFLAPHFMKRLLPGDRIEARLVKFNEKMQAEPEKLIKAAFSVVIGQAVKTKQGWVVKAKFPLLDFYLPIMDEKLSLLEDQLEEDCWVKAKLVQHAINNAKFAVVIEQIIAKKLQTDLPWQLTAARLNFPLAEPKLSQPLSLPEKNLAKTALSVLPFFSIDNAESLDIDDAFYISANGNHWQLSIAIADPTTIVTPDSEVDQEACQRGASLYLINKKVPMLPQNLAYEHCSLRAHTSRQAVICHLKINIKGEIENCSFQIATIRSQAQLTYDAVTEFFDKNAQCQTLQPAIAEQLLLLRDCYIARNRWRQQHALLAKQRTEFCFILDNQNHLIQIEPERRTIAHLIVEEMMLTANSCAANWLASLQKPAIFTSHPPIVESKRVQLAQLLKIANLKNSTDIVEHYQELSHWIAWRQQIDQTNNRWLESQLRLLQNQAYLTLTASAHFALGLPYYLTWTSPLRRYQDLFNLRCIKQALGMTLTIKPINNHLIHELNKKRVLNRKAERQIKQWLYAQYLQQSLVNQQVFIAQISAIRNHTIYLQLVANGANVIMLKKAHKNHSNISKINENEGTCTLMNQFNVKNGDQILVAINEIIENLGLIYVHFIAMP